MDKLKLWQVECEGLGRFERLEVESPTRPVGAKKWTFENGEYVIIVIFHNGTYSLTTATTDGNESRLYDIVQPEILAFHEKIKKEVYL